MRGIVLPRGDLSEERARELAMMDPRVKAGQLQAAIRPWFAAAGMLVFRANRCSLTTDAEKARALSQASGQCAGTERQQVEFLLRIHDELLDDRHGEVAILTVSVPGNGG